MLLFLSSWSSVRTNSLTLNTLNPWCCIIVSKQGYIYIILQIEWYFTIQKVSKKFVDEKKIQVEEKEFVDIQTMIVASEWEQLTTFSIEASKSLAIEFFPNASDLNPKGSLPHDQYFSYVRGKKVPFLLLKSSMKFIFYQTMRIFVFKQ